MVNLEKRTDQWSMMASFPLYQGYINVILFSDLWRKSERPPHLCEKTLEHFKKVSKYHSIFGGVAENREE